MIELIPDVVPLIFRYLSVYDVVRASSVSKTWNRYTENPRVWEVFASSLLIETSPSIHPKENIKKFYKISLGYYESFIKCNWSDQLKQKIRSLPFVEWKKIKKNNIWNPDILSSYLSDFKAPIRTLDALGNFVVIYPKNSTNPSIDLKIFTIELRKTYIREKKRKIRKYVARPLLRIRSYTKDKTNGNYYHTGSLNYGSLPDGKGVYPTLPNFMEDNFCESDSEEVNNQ